MAYDNEKATDPRAGRAIQSLDRDQAGNAAKTAWPSLPNAPHEGFSESLTLHNVEDAFQYHPWDGQQSDAGAQVRDALVNAAKVILRTVPSSPLRTRALNDLVDARMKANAAITFRGRF